MKKLAVTLVLMGLISCGGISIINRGAKDLYTTEFVAKIEVAKSIYSRGDKEEAMKRLALIKEQGLLPTEKAMKKNLLGVINFSEGNYEQAIYEFNLALSSSSLDKKLNAQIHLNLASSYYKLGDIEKTMATLLLCEFKALPKADFKNFHKLRHSIAKDLDQKRVSIESLMWLLTEYKEVSSLKSTKEFDELVAQYFSLDQYERLRLVKDFSDDEHLVAGYMTYLEVEQLFSQAKRDDALDLLDWIEDEYSDNSQIMELTKSFKVRIENYAAVNQFAIGVVLPLSGKKGTFGKRALVGIDHAVRSYNEKLKDKENFLPIKLHIADSEGSKTVGKRRVREMIENKNVSILIGGLFSDEAYAEYDASRKFGTFFISLSQIYAEKGQKDHLLVEIPGSVESQLSMIFSDRFLKTFGKDGAIIYPDSERGQAYVEEFWRRAQLTEANIINVHKFDRKKTDHRGTIKKLLGLRFKRERQEELEIIKELHELEGATSIRRIQDLKPEIDFDWAFIPSFPTEALQLIPSFSYYDAFNIPLIGDPSWRSKTVMRESHKLGRLYFVDSDVPKNESLFVDSFRARYGKKPGLIEILGYEAFEVANNILRTDKFETRAELERTLKDAQVLEGLTGSWTLEDNVWIKSMSMMSLYRGKTSKVDFVKRMNDIEAKEQEEAQALEAKEE